MNIDCRCFQESYGEPDMPDGLKRHGDTCQSCREFIQRQNALQQVLPVWKTPEVSPDFALDVMSRIAEDGERRLSPLDLLKELLQFRFSIPLPIGAMAGILFLISVLMNVFFWANHESAGINDQSRIALDQGSIAPNMNPTMVPGGDVMHTANDLQFGSMRGFMSLTQEIPGAGLFLLVPIVEPNLPMTSIEKTKKYEINNKQKI